MPPKRKAEEPESTSKRGKVAEEEPQSSSRPLSTGDAVVAAAAKLKSPVAAAQEALAKPLARAADSVVAAKAKAAAKAKVAPAAAEAAGDAGGAADAKPNRTAPRPKRAAAWIVGLVFLAWAVVRVAPWQRLLVDDYPLYDAVASRNASAVAAAVASAFDVNSDGAIDAAEGLKLRDALTFQRHRWACPTQPLVFTAASLGDVDTATLLIGYGAEVDAPAPPQLSWYSSVPVLSRLLASPHQVVPPEAPLSQDEDDDEEEPDADAAMDEEEEPSVLDAPPVGMGVAFTHELHVALAKHALERSLLHPWRRPAGRTALMLAAGQGNAAMVNLLLRAGACASAADSDGHGPLHFAASSSSAAAAEALLAAHGGAQATAKQLVSAAGLTPFDVAEALGKSNLARLLK